jgi:hypothetical protein
MILSPSLFFALFQALTLGCMDMWEDSHAWTPSLYPPHFKGERISNDILKLEIPDHSASPLTISPYPDCIHLVRR